MITRFRTPFQLSFQSRNEGISRIHRWQSMPSRLNPSYPAARLTENQDIALLFTGPPDFRFTMDGLDVVFVSGGERADGVTYVRPSKLSEPVTLFEGKDFPLVPGYYGITVTGRGKSWHSLVEITPKFLDKQDWQAMRDELLDEIKHLSFDFMKRSIHLPAALEGQLGLSMDMLLRFYVMSEESGRVLAVLDELSKAANARLVIKKRRLRIKPGGRPDRRVKESHFRLLPGAERAKALYMEVTRDVEENRFARTLIVKLEKNLSFFMEDIQRHAGKIASRQEDLYPYRRNREYKMGQQSLFHLDAYYEKAKKMRAVIRRVKEAPWFLEAKGPLPIAIPMTVFRDPRYSVLYRLHRAMEQPGDALDISDFYQFQWKRTDKLYELWCFLQFIKALSAKGWTIGEGPAVLCEEGRYRLSSLEAGTEILLMRENWVIRLVYDGHIPSSAGDTDLAHPLYTNTSHRRPDLRMDCYKDGYYGGSLVADFKYRDIYNLWQDEERSSGIREQFNSYRDMNTKYYRTLGETESLRDSRPVKEVWAVFPRETPPLSDTDYSLRFVSLAPCRDSHGRLADMLEDYIQSLDFETGVFAK